MGESFGKGMKLSVILGVLLLVGTIATTVAFADNQTKSNDPLKAPINPVKLEPGQVITPFGIYNVTKMYKTPDGVTHAEGKRISKGRVQPPLTDG